MYPNLQTYISELERAKELIRIKEFVDPTLEMAEIVDRVSKSHNGGKAILFENTGTGFPVLMNMMGSEERMCRVLGIKKYEEIAERIDGLFMSVLTPKQNLWDKLKLLPTLKQATGWMPRVSNKRGACQEVVMEKPDLSKLPILQCWPHDGGKFITLPMVHTKDPVTGMRNMGMYRMQVFSGTTTGMHWHKHKTGARHFQAFKDASDKLQVTSDKVTKLQSYELQDKKNTRHPSPVTRHSNRFPVAIALGGDPVYTYCATAPMPENVDEYLLAGFLRNKPVNLVRCLTQPLEVPADVDFVIEGYIDTDEALVTEGPFGDHTGFYSLEDLYPLLHITAITHRKDAIYPATLVGIPPQEDAYMGQASEKIFLSPIRLALAPEVIDLHMPFEGVAHNIVLVKIKNTYAGQAIKVAHALWGAGQMMFNKIMVVLDGDIELNDYTAVMQEITNNYRPEHDTYFSRGPLDVLDHSAAENGFGGKMCIDATKKMVQGEKVQGTRYKTQSAENPSPFHLSPFTLLFDEEVDTTDYATCAWLLGNNVDPMRDCKVEGGKLHIDARSKIMENGKWKMENDKNNNYQLSIINYQFPKRWPNIVCMNDTTIAGIDNKWNNLGLGNFIPSPSLKYKHLVKPGGAAVE